MAEVREKVGEVVSRAKRRVGVEAPDAADADGRVGIVRGALRAFGEGNMDGFLDALGDDVVWEAPSGERFPGSGQHSGRDAVRDEFVGAVKRTYSSFGFRPDSFLDVDDENAVVTIGRFEAEGAEGGNVDVAAAQLWEFKGNTASRVCIFVDSDGFPEVVSERDYEEAKKKEREESEQGSGGDGEAKSGDGAQSSSDGDAEGKSDGGAESRSDGEAEAKSDGGSEAKSDDGGEAKSDRGGQARSDDGAEARSGGDAEDDSEAKSEGDESAAKSRDEQG